QHRLEQKMILTAHERHLACARQIQRRKQPAEPAADDQYARLPVRHSSFILVGILFGAMVAEKHAPRTRTEARANVKLAVLSPCRRARQAIAGSCPLDRSSCWAYAGRRLRPPVARPRRGLRARAG